MPRALMRSALDMGGAAHLEAGDSGSGYLVKSGSVLASTMVTRQPNGSVTTSSA